MMKTVYKWNIHGVRAILGIVLLAVALYTVMPTVSAFADNPPLTPRGTCSNDPDFEIGLGGGGGLITGIVATMQSVLNSVTQNMYNNIVGNGNYGYAVKAAVMLYIAIYGIAFTVGAVSITVADLVTRCVKIAVIGYVISPSSWAMFNSTFINFFNNGTNELISVVTGIAVDPSNPMVLNAAPVFAPLDNAIQKILSAKMMVTMFSLVSPIPPFAPAGPNGMLVGLLLISGVSSFLRATTNAIWVYLMAMVLKSLLFGVAPLFLPMMLFSRTRHLFDGWLNQILNACLQPLMLFAFFSFFVILVSVMVDQILSTPVCWSGWNDGVRGAPFIEHWWRFAVKDPDIGAYVPYTGIWNFTGSADGHPFPIRVGMVMMFMMIAELSVRFNAVVIEIAKDLSGAATDLSGMAGSISEWFSKNNPMAGDAKGNISKQAAQNSREGRMLGASPQQGATRNSFFDKGLSGVFSKGGILEGTKITGADAKPTGAGAAASRVQASRQAAAAQVGVRPAIGGVGVDTAAAGSTYAGASNPLRWKREYYTPEGTTASNLRDSITNYLTGGRPKV